MQPRVPSPIPDGAVEQVVARHENGVKQQSEFVADGGVVGGRLYDDAGFAVCEWGEKDGHLHGTMLEWTERGVLSSAIPYRGGREHGIARQWSRDGRLLGRYRMNDGTGWDLWWEESEPDGAQYLAEARRFENGTREGYEWWINSDQKTVHCETSYRRNIEHGIRREWNADGALAKGFPRFLVEGKKVTRKVYEAAAKRDRGLPAYRASDDRPTRTFPADVKAALNVPKPTKARTPRRARKR